MVTSVATLEYVRTIAFDATVARVIGTFDEAALELGHEEGHVATGSQ